VPTELLVLGQQLREVLGFTLPELTAEQSEFHKRLQLHPEKPLTYEDVVWRTNLKMFGWFK
jgi:hypothetical protein